MTAPEPGPGRAGRAVRLAAVAVLGLLLGGAGYLVIQVANPPGPRAAPGWSLLAEMPNPRGETTAAVAGDLLYVIGGLAGLAAQASADVSVYSPATDSWGAGPPLPEARHHAAAVALDGAIYVSGGAASATDWSPRDRLWVLAPGGTAWRELAPMPQARYGHRMVAVGERLYVVGGVPGGGAAGQATIAILAYEPELNTWSEAAALPLNRDHLAAVVVDGEIWTIGGRANGLNHARVDIYDPATDAWRDGPALPVSTSGASEGAVDGVIYISGGEDPGAGVIVDRHWQLDTRVGSTAAWEALEPPPLTVHGAPGAVLNGRFVIVSGSLRAAGQSSTAWTGATQLLRTLP